MLEEIFDLTITDYDNQLHEYKAINEETGEEIGLDLELKGLVFAGDKSLRGAIVVKGIRKNLNLKACIIATKILFRGRIAS